MKRRRCPRPARKFVFETLENRLALHGDVVVTPTHVIAESDAVPRFAANAEFVAIRDGLWSDPLTWNQQRTPGQNAKVQIPHTMDVLYDANSTTELEAIEVSGTLQFVSSVTTKLVVSTLMVMPDGELSIGTEQSPIAASAEIVFPNKAINTDLDPEQWGNGLLVFGKIDVYGLEKTSSYVRLAEEPLVGTQELVLAEAPIGWKTGDELVLPDTNSSWSENRIEELRIESIRDNRVRLQSPLQFDHKGAKLADGTIQAMPHIGNLSRTVTIRSQSMRGPIGHTAYFSRADVSINYAKFQFLGRTTIEKLDDTTFNADGSVAHIGTNQAGRYAVHFHHLIGPENPTNSGFQVEFVGNSVDCGMRWAVVLHGTSYARIAENFIYQVQGAGIVTEDGTEAFNLIDHNFVVRASGGGLFKTGDAGEGIWLRGPLNQVSNNVVANVGRAAYHIFTQNLPKTLQKPLFRGANPHDPLETEPFDPEKTPWLGFVNNEAYGSRAGIDIWSSLPETRQYITGFSAWHTSDNSFILSNYVTKNVVIDGLNFVGDFANVSSSRLQKFQPIPETGLQAVRESSNLTVRNTSTRGVQTGIESPALQVERMLIQDTTIQAYTGVKIGRLTTGSFNSVGQDVPYGSLTIENTRFESMPFNRAQPEQWRVYLDFDTTVSAGTNLLNTSEVFLIDFNGIKGANYQVYYLEQAPNFIVPVSVNAADSRSNFTASPEAGLTNAQLFARYGVALAGAVAPSREIDGDDGQAALARGHALGIRGLVFPLQVVAAPTVFAGEDASGQQYQQITLNGSVIGGSADWSKLLGPGEVTFSNVQSTSAKVTFSAPGDYVLRLTGSSFNRREFDDVHFRIVAAPDSNLPPRADAGEDLILDSTNVARLNGDVRDDGKSPLSIAWSVLSGPGIATFDDASQSNPLVTFAARGAYVLQILVSDGLSTTSDTVSVIVNAVVSRSPLIGSWSLDSTDSSSIIDGSGNGLNSRIVGGYRNVDGVFGDAIELAGGYIAMPVHDLLAPRQGLTVSLWIRPQSMARSQTLFNWEGGSWDAFGMVLTNDSATSFIDVEATTSIGPTRFRISSDAFATDQWTHLAMTFSDANGGGLKIYRNGNLIGSRIGIGTGLNYRSFGSRQLTFGTEFAGSVDTLFRGGLDDIRIFNFALSPLQFDQLGVFPSGSEGESPDLAKANATGSVNSIWHNVLRPTDVNGDGQTTPVDALIAISQIRRTRTLSSAPDADVLLLDVNNDLTLSPVDALLIISEINRARNNSTAKTEAPPEQVDYLSSEFTAIERRKRLLSAQDRL